MSIIYVNFSQYVLESLKYTSNKSSVRVSYKIRSGILKERYHEERKT
jgi:hypothetical protein